MSSRRTRSLQPIALTAPESSHRCVASRRSARGTWRTTVKTPRIASSARSGSSSWLARMSEAPDASWPNDARRRSLFQRDAWTMPRPRNATTSVIVRPTGRRRGAHSERGRPISVSTIGVAMSSPARSPSHHVAQVTGAFAAVTIAPARRAAVEMLQPTMLLAAQQARKAATSRGSVSVSGWRTKRRTSAAPAAACSTAARASTNGTATTSGSLNPRGAVSRRFAAIAPSATPKSMRRPKTRTLASAMPAAG